MKNPIWLHDVDIIQQVDQLLLEAVSNNASDIHIEPYHTTYRIRLRKDGLLYHLASFDLPLAERMIARLKVLSHVDVAEKRLPQDGHFLLTTSNSTVDIRLSTCPTIYGEKVVLRLLNPNTLLKYVDELGLEAIQKQRFVSALEKPQGLILLIGPTGSGKTVSMYAALRLLNLTEKNILTIEDPVEINISGLNQVNINPKAGLTFASALRSFLRQDPDVIMVGEIRDVETAQIVIKSSQTGHLILSTLHAQNTVQALSRLRGLELTKEEIQSNLLLLVAQRLVRKLCSYCKIPYEEGEAPLLKGHTIFKPVGCEHCQSGYAGRIGIFELLPMTPAFMDAYSQKNARFCLESLLKKYASSLRLSGFQKVIQGVTSVEEVNRVVPNEFVI